MTKIHWKRMKTCDRLLFTWKVII